MHVSIYMQYNSVMTDYMMLSSYHYCLENVVGSLHGVVELVVCWVKEITRTGSLIQLITY